jgi:hypothetical protein
MRARSWSGPLALVLVVFAVLLAEAPAASAQPCGSTCALANRVCSRGARTARMACLQGCATGDAQCFMGCLTAARTARVACRAARGDCMSSCPASAAASAAPCPVACTGSAAPCFTGAFSDGTTCVERCKAGGAPPLAACLQQCAAAMGASRSTCVAGFQGCLGQCDGPVTGACFSTVAMECTAEPCGPDRPCAQPNEFCSPRCDMSSGGGACIDLETRECTPQACSAAAPCPSASQLCVPSCPASVPQGMCFDIDARACTDVACDPSQPCTLPDQICTWQCPPPTPLPSCASVPCGGDCAISPVCSPGAPCPAYPSRLGKCATDPSGTCVCVPATPRDTPTPQPTPPPQCTDIPCGGTCVAGGPVPCPPGKICNGPLIPAIAGQCAITADGSCQCVPIRPTPPATPTPQCGGPQCGGRCVIGPVCPPGQVCPEASFVSRPGQCTGAADGTCQCVPLAPPPTPTPECATDADCADGDGCTADRCLGGECEHVCICVTAAGVPACCPGPAALCAKPCGVDAAGTCGGVCPFGSTCDALSNADTPCACVSGPGGPCGGNIFAPEPVCAPGLVCRQALPDVTGYCEKPDCIPLFTAGCTDTSDCCQPCENGTRAPCGVCSNGTCEGAP